MQNCRNLKIAESLGGVEVQSYRGANFLKQLVK